MHAMDLCDIRLRRDHDLTKHTIDRRLLPALHHEYWHARS
jgi:hypothetical protein